MLKVKDVKLEENLMFEEHSIQILDRWANELKHRQIPLVKVL